MDERGLRRVGAVADVEGFDLVFVAVVVDVAVDVVVEN